MKKVLSLKNLLYFFLIFICAFILFIRFMNLNDKLPFGLWYVHSNSMEPVIKADDGYILIRSEEYKINDIITFIPQVLDDKYVTHRIVEINDDGMFITKGDYNQMTDQEGGEPAVNRAQVIGKVLMINEKPVIIPYLGYISQKVNDMIEGLNTFELLSIGVVLYAIGYILDIIAERNKPARKKKLRLRDIAPYFDWVLIVLCITMFSNIVFLGLTVKSWGIDVVGYVVVTTEGVSAPLSGEMFTEERGLENKSFLHFVIMTEPQRQGVEVEPKKLKLSPNQHQEYRITIKAPYDTGYYTEKIHKRVYPDVLPDELLDYLYSSNEFLPLIVIFGPGIIMNIGLYIWWNRRWQPGKKEVMDWLITFRNVFKPAFRG